MEEWEWLKKNLELVLDDNGTPTTWQGSLWLGTADLFVTISDGERLFFLSTCLARTRVCGIRTPDIGH
jgi:hypothetical protein